jgi:uncharacterized membrane protein YkvA (DUF1232 family)
MEPLEDYSKYEKHYSDNQFWDKVRKVARAAGIKVIYVALELYYVLRNPGTPKADRAKILGALGYFILPLDILPDALPLVGYTDDLAAISWCIYSVAKNITPEVREKAAGQLRKWFGDFDESVLSNFFKQQ